jgi:4-hydroxy-tetrahydrodipicolinate reductase
MTRIGILGAAGRMGQAIAAALGGDDRATLAGGVDRAGGAIAGQPIGDDPAALARDCDVLIDFTVPAALAGNLAAAVAAGRPIVVGTTGLSDAHHAAIDDAARHIAVLQTGNTSLGVTLLAALVRDAAARLGDDWDIEIVETHHRHKVDAPSGTALLLGEAAAAGRGVSLGDVSTRGRDGITGARTPGAIGFASLRGGSVAGDHMVVLAGDGERIELGHRAESRDIFARGAIRAACWIAGCGAGRYAMTDVLDL